MQYSSKRLEPQEDVLMLLLITIVNHLEEWESIPSSE